MFGNGYGHTSSSRSPPPLQHPIPTHPHFIPEPPETPITGGTEPQGYMRFSSEQQRPPVEAFAHQQARSSQFTGGAPVPGANSAALYGLQQPPMNPYGAYSQPGIPPMGQMGAPPYGMQPGIGGPLPDMSMWGVNDATAQLGMQLGRSAVQAGQQYVQQNVSEHVSNRAWHLARTSLYRSKYNPSFFGTRLDLRLVMIYIVQGLLHPNAFACKGTTALCLTFGHLLTLVPSSVVGYFQCPNSNSLLTSQTPTSQKSSAY